MFSVPLSLKGRNLRSRLGRNRAPTEPLWKRLVEQIRVRPIVGASAALPPRGTADDADRAGCNTEPRRAVSILLLALRNVLS